MKTNSVVYQIKNLCNNKVYIGSTKDSQYRLKKHLQDLRANRHHNNHLQSSWNKYGESNFETSIIEKVNIENLFDKETFYIDLLESNKSEFGYNKASPDNNHISSEDYKRKMSKITKEWWSKNNREITEETKKKISDTLKGRRLSKSHKDNIQKVVSGENNPFYGKNHTEETKKKISEKITGHIESEETRRKKSEAIKKKWQDPEFREKMMKARRIV